MDDIDYFDQLLYIKDPDGCLPRWFLNFNFTTMGSPFYYSLETDEYYDFYNCSNVRRLKTERYKLIHEDHENNVSSSEQIQDLKLPLRSRLRSYLQLVGSANKLFCLRGENCFILWNPCIRKFITRPNPSVTAEFPCYLAFGFDLRTNDYKVVTIAYQSYTRYEGAKPPLVEVYSVSEGSWRVTSGGDSYPPKITMSNWPHQAASLNGAVYFVANDWGDARSLIVLSFDLGDEVFHLISLPNGKFGLHADASIFTSEFKGLLSLICYESWRYGYSIWVMKEYGIVDSWTKQFTIDLKTRVQEWTRVLNLTCPMKTFTGHKPHPDLNMKYWKVTTFSPLKPLRCTLFLLSQSLPAADGLIEVWAYCDE
ncbi:F-box/kelch-repeat protein At3g23880-like [Castanea sativa]|uniref:F-box/kelch-repeat protein At3g23880-like n=1 Tax=Castanea sativa TaxID=21020 RepID=UPI003F650229